MPFYLSIKPQVIEVKIPDYQYEKMHEAEAKADEILKTVPGLHFIGVFFTDENTPPRLITNLIQRGYKLYSWTQYKYFDRFNKISSFFVLNGDHYIKLKPNKF